eukprot:4484836-Pleurochrysis_carterae.AAC.1
MRGRHTRRRARLDFAQLALARVRLARHLALGDAALVGAEALVLLRLCLAEGRLRAAATRGARARAEAVSLLGILGQRSSGGLKCTRGKPECCQKDACKCGHNAANKRRPVRELR